MASDDFAVVIGINRYPKLSHLNGAERDAERFLVWLRDPHGGDIPDNHIEVLTSSNPRYGISSAPGRPAEQDVDDIFEDWVRTTIQTGNHRIGRRLYFFAAGHGFAPEPNETALLTANAFDVLGLGHHIACERYANRLREGALFDQVVVFMDCCRVFNARYSYREPPWQVDNQAAAVVEYFRGWATQFSTISREARIDGEIRGLFTTALVEGLERGRQTGQDLKNYVHSRLSQLHRDSVERLKYGEKLQDADFYSTVQESRFIFGEQSPIQAVLTDTRTPDPTSKVKRFDITFRAGRNAMLHGYQIFGPDTKLRETVSPNTRLEVLKLEQGYFRLVVPVPDAPLTNFLEITADAEIRTL